jgi:DNA-binding NarL/FixJ family response regulator
MPGFDALHALKIRNELCAHTPFAIVSEDMPAEDIKKAMELGCGAYISKEHLSMLGQKAKGLLESNVVIGREKIINPLP